jgi:hypothetical protein
MHSITKIWDACYPWILQLINSFRSLIQRIQTMSYTHINFSFPLIITRAAAQALQGCKGLGPRLLRSESSTTPRIHSLAIDGLLSINMFSGPQFQPARAPI